MVFNPFFLSTFYPRQPFFLPAFYPRLLPKQNTLSNKIWVDLLQLIKSIVTLGFQKWFFLQLRIGPTDLFLVVPRYDAIFPKLSTNSCYRSTYLWGGAAGCNREKQIQLRRTTNHHDSVERYSHEGDLIKVVVIVRHVLCTVT